jgi:quercetin dioxygenase-like cupin family protein
MAYSGQEIANPRTGQRMRFLKTAAETGGALLSMQTTNPPAGKFEPLHVHPRQESRARVLSGSLHFVVEGEPRLIGPGQAVMIAAGTPHHFCNDGAEDTVAVQEFRPALRTAEFFETYFELARRGELDQDGRPSLLRFAVLGPAFSDEIRLVSPPWPLQRAAFALLGPLGRARGYGVS